MFFKTLSIKKISKVWIKIGILKRISPFFKNNVVYDLPSHLVRFILILFELNNYSILFFIVKVQNVKNFKISLYVHKNYIN